MPLNVKVDTTELAAMTRGIYKAIPKITARALNETAKDAKSKAEKAAASKLGLPQKLIKKRLDKFGKVKGDRSRFNKATRAHLSASLNVYMRGVPVYQIAGKQPKKKRAGVKAKGGRFYKGAFYASNRGGKPIVFKRRSNQKLMVPKIGVRRELNKQYESRISSQGAINEYRRRWNRLASFEFEKINNGV